MKTQRCKTFASIKHSEFKKYEYVYYIDKGSIQKAKTDKQTNAYIFFTTGRRKSKTNVFPTIHDAEIRLFNDIRTMFLQYNIDIIYGVDIVNKFINNYPEEFI